MEEPTRRPPPRGDPRGDPPGDRTTARVLAVAGVLGLLIVFVVIIAMIGGAGGGDSGEEAAATATATATPEPTRTPKPSPTPVPLTPDQKLDRQDAIDVVRSRGFEIVSKRDWSPTDTLKVLIGRSSSGGLLAFFFVNGEYLGNDSTDPSVELEVKKTDDLEVTLRYGIFAPGDEPDTPTGDPISVHFRYDGAEVGAVEALPAPEQRTPGLQP